MQYVAFTEEQFKALDDLLTEIRQGGGSYILPPATTSTLGGVIPDGTTVTVDNDGTIHAAAGGGGTAIDLGITGASVGKVAAVAAVDADGKPTAWTHASAASASSVPDAGSVSSTGLMSIKHGSTTLFTVQLPLYAGGVS